MRHAQSCAACSRDGFSRHAQSCAACSRNGFSRHAQWRAACSRDGFSRHAQWCAACSRDGCPLRTQWRAACSRDGFLAPCPVVRQLGRAHHALSSRSFAGNTLPGGQLACHALKRYRVQQRGQQCALVGVLFGYDLALSVNAADELPLRIGHQYGARGAAARRRGAESHASVRQGLRRCAPTRIAGPRGSGGRSVSRSHLL